MNYKETYQEWLSNPYFDEDTKKELTAIRRSCIWYCWTSWNHRCWYQPYEYLCCKKGYSRIS